MSNEKSFIRKINNKCYVSFRNNHIYIFPGGYCTAAPTTTYTCFNIADSNYPGVEPWDISACNNDKNHPITLLKNNYLVQQISDPPSYAPSLLCNYNYNVSLSNKIKITIPDDPIFSGTYVFDYTFAGGSSLLSSSNWVLNSGESSHNLFPYDHPESQASGKLLVSLSDGTEFTLGDYGNYDGYIELKTSYYKDENNVSARQLEDVFAFPAQFVFTAVQPPCPCTGVPGVDYVGTIGTGHRVTVALTAPIRWRHPYRNWVLVDKISHTINNSIINYASGSVFNDGVSYFSSTDDSSVYLPNSKYIKYTKSYVPGTIPADNIIGEGYMGLSNGYNGLTPVCTGISDLGIAFRSSASGLGIDRYYYYGQNNSIQGIGRFQEFIRDVGNNFAFTIKDERPFFDNKVPIKAVVEFVYSCRSGLPCSFNDTPTNVSTITGLLTNGCSASYNFIGTDFLCGDDEQVSPPDSVWTNKGITSTTIIYSGYSGYPFISPSYTYTDRILPILTTGQLFNNKIVNIYDFDPSTVNSNITIRSTGGLPSDIRNFLQTNVFVCNVRTQNSDPTSSPIVTRNQYNKWDLYWSINSSSNTAKVYIVPDVESLSVPYIVITGAGSTEVDGTYIYNGGYNPILDNYGNIFVKTTNGINYRLALSATGLLNVPSQWKIQKLFLNVHENRWVDFYGNNGVYTGILNYTNNRKIGIVNNNWFTDERCYLGEYPPPSSITYYYK
jgi:hypothetical protein